jgi:hypothetical protein
MFVKCTIIKLEPMDTCGRQSHVEQPITLDSSTLGKKKLIKVKHAPITIQVNKPSIHNDSIINK